jgi:hypothetical protein
MTNLTKLREEGDKEFREYFDKILRPQRTTMKDLDRELCINYIHQREDKAYQLGQQDTLERERTRIAEEVEKPKRRKTKRK